MSKHFMIAVDCCATCQNIYGVMEYIDAWSGDAFCNFNGRRSHELVAKNRNGITNTCPAWQEAQKEKE